MVMLTAEEERRVREKAMQAACTLLSGTLPDAPGVLTVAHMAYTYITGGWEAATNLLAAMEQASPQATEDATPDGGASASTSRAQELAEEGYRAQDKVRVRELLGLAEKEGELLSSVMIENATGPLEGYLDMLLRSSLPDGTPPRNETLRSELGL